MAAIPGDQPDLVDGIERRLISHVERGGVLDMAGDAPVDQTAMRSWGSARTVPAGLIRDILRGKLVSDPDPHGLRLRGVRIGGRLDLDNITSTVRLELSDCLLDEGVNARDAKFPGLILIRCHLEHPNEPALDAERFTTTVLNLEYTTATAHAEGGAIRLAGAHLGYLHCDGASLRNDTGPALIADNIKVDQSVFLRDGFTAIAAGELSAVRLTNAHLGALECESASLCNDTGPALYANNLEVDQNLFLRDKFTAIGDGELGAVLLVGAHVGGVLDLSSANLRNDTGPALAADGLEVDQFVLLNGFNAVGDGELGAVRLLGAHFGAELHGDGASLCNATGPALVADRIEVDQSVFLRDGFTAVGASEQAAVRLISAHLGELQCDGASLRNDTGPALAARNLRVDQNLYLNERFEAVGAGDRVALDLGSVRVGGILNFDPRRLEHRTNSHRLLRLDGLEYTGLPRGVSTQAWLCLLREGAPDYAAQPYQHLAAAHRAAGHDREARQILMAQRRDQIHSGTLTRRAERTWARFTGLVLGYGYQPWRALIGLVLVIATAVALTSILGGHAGLTRVRIPSAPTPTDCTWVERVGVGLDLGTPLITTGAQTRCETTNAATGQTLAIAGWTLRLFAWALATLFIAGFTSAVRKT